MLFEFTDEIYLVGIAGAFAELADGIVVGTKEHRRLRQAAVDEKGAQGLSCRPLEFTIGENPP